MKKNSIPRRYIHVFATGQTTGSYCQVLIGFVLFIKVPLAPYTVDYAMYACPSGGGDTFLKTKSKLHPAEPINEFVVGDIIL